MAMMTRDAQAGRWRSTAQAKQMAVVVALFATAGLVWLQYTYLWTGLERYYLRTYIRATVRTEFGSWTPPKAAYTLLLVSDQAARRTRAVIEADVEEAPTERPPFTASRSARSAGYCCVIERTRDVTTAGVLATVRDVYHGRPLWVLALRLLMPAPVLLLVGFTLAWPIDRTAERARREGGRTKGTEDVSSPKEFNAIVKGDGLRLGGPDGIIIPAMDVARHIVVIGQTGTGKSQVAQDILRQVRRNGDAAIIVDVACEHVSRFYDPETDRILNPMDPRSPGWNIGGDIRHPMEALSVARALVPARAEGLSGSEAFFNEGCTRFLAYLLGLKTQIPGTTDPQALEPVRTHQLIRWLNDETMLDYLAQGTRHAHFLTQESGAGGQRAGALGTLGKVADILSAIPPERQWMSEFSAHEWAARRPARGFLFLTSTAKTRDRVVPIQSIWLDLLMLNLMNDDIAPDARRVYLMLDEIPVFNHLPQLSVALEQGRKYRMPIVMNLQGTGQLRSRYGAETAETMLGMCATTIQMSTSSVKDAQRGRDVVGQQETERVNEGRDASGLIGSGKVHHNMVRTVEDVALASEIMGLHDLQAIVRFKRWVVKVTWPYVQMPVIAAGLIMRDDVGTTQASPTSLPTADQTPTTPPVESGEGGTSEQAVPDATATTDALTLA